MTRIPSHKELKNSRLANTYGGWVYCEQCNKTIGYLCYVTYEIFKFEYRCKCGNHGVVDIAFGNDTAHTAKQPLVKIKNRLCCGGDESPIVTILTKNLDAYKYEVICKACNTKYQEGYEL
jgi:hypothetical protein